MRADQRKRLLRAELRASRRALSADAARAEAAAVVARLTGLVAALAPTALASYQALGDELAVDALHAWWRARGGALLLPRVRAPGELAWHEVRSDGELVVGAYGIREPRADAPAMALPRGVCAIVPGVAFGADGRRLGQGGGFYDRVLADLDGISIGVGYACQRRDDLPVEAHDRAVDGVVLGGEIVRDPRARRGGAA